MNAFLTFILFAPTLLIAGAHSHSEAELDIAVNDKTVTVDFEAPADMIYGFEHDAKTDADKKKRDAGIAKLEKNIGSIVKLDAKLECTWATKKIEAFVAEKDDHHGKPTDKKHKGQHGEVKASFEATCKNAPAGTKLTFGGKAIFPKMKDIEVKAVSGDKQSGADIKNDKGSIEL